MRAARDWRDPVLGRWGIKGRHHPRALRFKEALRAFEDSLCTCGHSAFVTYDKHQNTRDFKIAKVVCVACEHRDADAQSASAKADESTYGQKTFVRHNPEAVTDA